MLISHAFAPGSPFRLFPPPRPAEPAGSREPVDEGPKKARGKKVQLERRWVSKVSKRKCFFLYFFKCFFWKENGFWVFFFFLMFFVDFDWFLLMFFVGMTQVQFPLGCRFRPIPGARSTPIAYRLGGPRGLGLKTLAETGRCLLGWFLLWFALVWLLVWLLVYLNLFVCY